MLVRAADGDLVGPYRVGEVLGQGGMGVVYRATDERDGREVALKTVLSRSRGNVSSIRLEVATLARIRHPGVVRVFEHGLHDGSPWYSMELLEGRTMRDLLSDSDGPPLPLHEALKLVHQICEPLAYLHGEGVVHRDLKPSNVFLKHDGTPVLVDFGLVQRFGGSGRREKLDEGETPAAGTYMYMSPEQLSEGVLDPRADIYALGCLLFQLLVGDPPFRGTAFQLTLMHLQSMPPTPSSIRPELPAALDTLVDGMMQKLPADRIGYATDVAESIRAIASELGHPIEPSPEVPRDYLYRPDISGREPIIESIEATLADPEHRVLVMHGASGVGKTRIATELARRLRLSKVRIAKGVCEPLAGARRGSGGTPLHGLRGVLRDIGDFCRANGKAATRRVFGQRAAVLAMYEPSLEDLVDPGATHPVWLPTTEASRQRLQTWLARTLTEYAQGRRVVVFVDDLQWADELSLEFLRAVSRGLPCDGVHFVCTCRDPESIVALLEEPGTVDVPVGPLDREAVTSMVADMLGHASSPSSLVDTVLERTAGNPLFINELLHAAMARGALRREHGRAWVLSMQEELAAPRTVAELVALRVEAEEVSARALLEVLAALGQPTTPTELAAIADQAEAEVMTLGGELIARDVIEETAIGELRFAHPVLQETIYERTDPGRRRSLHRAVAETVGTLDPHARATHWDRAGEPAAAAPLYLEAAVRAQDMTASARAFEAFERGFALEREAGLEPDDGLGRRRVELSYGKALAATGRMEDAERVLRETLERLGTPLPRTRVGWGLHMARELAVLAGVRSRPAADRPEVNELALAGLQSLTATLLTQADTLGQMGTALTGGNLAAVSRPGPTTAVGHSRVGLIAGLVGLEGVSESCFEVARSKRGDAPLPPTVYVNETLVYLARGRWAKLAQVAPEATRACRELGDHQAEVQVRLFTAGASLVRGRPAEVIHITEQALPIAREHGYAIERGHLLGNRAGGTVLTGDAARTREAVDEYAQALDGGGDPVARPRGGGYEAGAGLREGSRDTARVADAAFASLREAPRGSPGFVVHHLFLTPVYLGLAQRGDRDALTKADALASGLRRLAFVQPSAGPWAALFQGTVDRLAGRDRRAGRRLERARRGAARLDLDGALGAARYERGLLEGREDAAAERILRDVGASFPPFYAWRDR